MDSIIFKRSYLCKSFITSTNQLALVCWMMQKVLLSQCDMTLKQISYDKMSGRL